MDIPGGVLQEIRLIRFIGISTFQWVWFSCVILEDKIVAKLNWRFWLDGN
jgi:hypothetical protein